MKALILAGGLGSRLRPLTQTGAKQLLPVANKPLIFHVLEDIAAMGVREVVVVVGTETTQGIRAALQNGSQWGLHIEYVHQEQPLGLAHAVLISEAAIGDSPFAMYLGDNLIQGGTKGFRKQFEETRPAALLVLHHVDNPRELGVAEFNSLGKLVRVVEKPANPPSNWAVTGIYFFDKRIFDAAKAIKPSRRNELEITDAIQWLIDHHQPVEVARHEGWWKDTGKPEDILEANMLVLQGIHGAVDPSAQVDASSHLVGEVILGPNVVVSGSTIRGPVIVGANARIEESFIGPFTAIGAGAVIHKSEVSASIIMEQARITNVPVMLDWALVGRNAIVESRGKRPAAHSLVLGDSSRVTLA